MHFIFEAGVDVHGGGGGHGVCVCVCICDDASNGHEVRRDGKNTLQ